MLVLRQNSSVFSANMLRQLTVLEDAGCITASGFESGCRLVRRLPSSRMMSLPLGSKCLQQICGSFAWTETWRFVYLHVPRLPNPPCKLFFFHYHIQSTNGILKLARCGCGINGETFCFWTQVYIYIDKQIKHIK